MAHLHMITIIAPTGERFRVPVVSDPNSARRRGARTARILRNGGWLDCDHHSEITRRGRNGRPDVRRTLADTDRHYRDGRGWAVEGERSDKDYALGACLAVCNDCNQNGDKSADTDARLTAALLATLRADAKQAATV